MPTSAPGSRRSQRVAGRAASCGFTVVELLIVIAIMAVAVSLVTWALPDGDASRLEEEGARLTALLEMARAEARVSGATVRWVPRGDTGAGGAASGEAADFRFVGLPAALALPGRWLDGRISAEVLLGPEAILPPQRIVLHLADKRLLLSSDGLGPFAAVEAAAPAAAGAPPDAVPR